MLLRELAVENHRGIRRAELSLEPTTVLIGENGCGVADLLGALELALGPGDADADAGDDARRADRAGGPARIVLAFEERAAGEWDAPEHAPLRKVLPATGRRPRRLLFELRSDGGGDGWVRHVRGARDAASDRALVAHVRSASPLIRVSGGAITGQGRAARRPARADLSALEPDVARLVARLLRAADALLRGEARDPEARLDVGFRAARELLARRPQHVEALRGGLARTVQEILGNEPAGSRATGAAAHEEGATTAERLGVLLLLAALLRRIPAGLRPGCEPIWIVEEPEAHLHPTTLASAARLIDRIRWQKIVTTQSAELCGHTPLRQIRRLVRHDGRLVAHGVRPKALSSEDLRRIDHHLRRRRGVAMFARVWLLVEGESEVWILTQIASVLGRDLDLAGIACVEYAQSGLEPLLRAARELGIDWHLLADGDAAGLGYATTARRFARPAERDARITVLSERDIEHCMWRYGHEAVLRRAAGPAHRSGRGGPGGRTIASAVRKSSKPGLALMLVESIAKRGPAGVPAPLARVVAACHALASASPARATAAART